MNKVNNLQNVVSKTTLLSSTHVSYDSHNTVYYEHEI